MRKTVVAFAAALVLSIPGTAFAQPPEEDPSRGNGRNGNRGCQGLANAPDTPGTTLARLILGCNGD